VATARDLATWRPWNESEITFDDLGTAARQHSSQGLGQVARKIQTQYSWDDIVLPADQKAQLQEVCGYFENMPVVYGQWGFQSKTNLGKGLTILFAGQSGTGKTMASEIMAGALGLDLYKIDLSSLVSKYIGDTEKNLDLVFREAEDSNSILFFDEADAIFGKRSEVRDAHDRYANVETSYLLQKMEEYQGIVILATNFRRNMDDAFVRRLQFAVEFPFPEEDYRLQIWERVFPEQAPLNEDVDLRFLARQLKISGGNIKNIAVAGAFLAAQASTSIGMEQVMWATKREYQKMGKLLVDSDFGQYFDLVKGESHAQV
jgi:SpoVK/Ycf46/Vps4 family AAA+-type ATPase